MKGHRFEEDLTELLAVIPSAAVSVSPPQQPIRFDDFELDLTSGELRRRGVKVRLHERSFQVLSALLEGPGEVVTRQELQRRLWPEDTFLEFDNNLNNAVSRLREALGESADDPRFIETVPRRGYRFIGPIINDQETEPAPPPTTVEPPRTPRLVPWRIATVAVTFLMVAALIVGVLRPGWLSRSRGAGNSTVQALAVLPFLNLSADAAQDYFADGMTEALIVELSTLQGVRVISRTSSMQYKAVSKPVAEIADELGVDAVVEGSVLRDGNRMRVTVQLIRAHSDANVWTQSFEREVGTILVFQRDVARTIAEAINVSVGGNRRVAGRIDPDIYELYLRGRHLLNRRTEADLQKALEYFEAVIKGDPGYAPAHAAVSAAWEAMADWNSLVSPSEGLPRARAAALRALELDPLLADAHVRLAFVNEAYEWRVPEAEAGYKRALELDPNSADAYQHYALHLSRLGRNTEALEMARRAHQLDPLALDVNVQYGTRLLDSGMPEEALTRLQRTVELDPNYYDTYVHLSHVFEALRRAEDQVAAARRGVDVSGRAPHALQALARAYAVTGNRAEAMKILDELHQRPTQRNAYDVAMIHLRLQEYDRSLQWLVKACEERAAALAFFPQLHAGRQFDPIRKDQRFEHVMRCTDAAIRK